MIKHLLLQKIFKILIGDGGERHVHRPLETETITNRSCVNSIQPLEPKLADSLESPTDHMIQMIQKFLSHALVQAATVALSQDIPDIQLL